MSNVIIMANKVTLKGVVDRAFLETRFSLIIMYLEYPSFLDYTKGVAKAAIGLMNIGQQGIFKVILCHQETP